MTKVEGRYDIDAVRREWVGKAGPVNRGRYPVEYDPVRRHCHMVEDANPLFLDPEFGEKTRFGGTIVPPVMVDYFAGMGVWPPSERTGGVFTIPSRGDRAINLNQVMEFLKPVKIGDRLSSQMVVLDIKEKAIRLDPLAIWVTFETRLTNQDGDLVATIRNTLLMHREPEEVANHETE